MLEEVVHDQLGGVVGGGFGQGVRGKRRTRQDLREKARGGQAEECRGVTTSRIKSPSRQALSGADIDRKSVV